VADNAVILVGLITGGINAFQKQNTLGIIMFLDINTLLFMLPGI